MSGCVRDYASPHTLAPLLRPRLVGARIPRSEDARLVSGRGRFLDDIELPRMLHASFVRSPLPLASIRALDIDDARTAPGVGIVWTAEDVRPFCAGLESGLQTEGLEGTVQPLLADRYVRHVGEAVAVVVADTTYQAEDAAALVGLDLEPLDPVTGWEEALAANRRANDTVSSNLVFDRERAFGAPDEAFEGAAVLVSGRYVCSRVSPAPLETRGYLADYDWATKRLTLWSSTQMPFVVRSLLAHHLRIAEHELEVIAPDVGGAFGQKGNLFPEEALVCLLSRFLQRPVRWTEDRRENLLAGSHAKHQVNELELALDAAGRIVGLADRIVGDGGAYQTCPFTQLVEPLAATVNLTGVYKVSSIRERVQAVMTNTCPVGAYRGIGYGAPQIARESLLDEAARRLALSPFEIRRRNVIRPEDFPYTSFNAVYSEGSYLESIDSLEEMVGWEEFRERQRQAREHGRHLGLGISIFNESTGGGTQSTYVTGFNRTTHDTSAVRMDPSGKVTVTTSLVSQGQGHATAFAQLAADALGVAFEDVVVHAGGTRQTWGLGTWGSRAAIIGGGSILRAAAVLREKLVRTAAHLLEAAPEDVVLENRRAFVLGSPARAVSIPELADAIYFAWQKRPLDLDPTLEATAAYDPPAAIFANGAHAAVVEVDLETGGVQVERVYAVEDCGVMINPAIVEGQIRGGIAQAIGQALYEELIYDEDGQLVTASFADYLIPTAFEVPEIEIRHLETPCSYSPAGVKGMGESAMVSAPAALLNAVNDALHPFGVRLTEVPLTPSRIHAALAA